jgi:hypothetical protein
VRVALFVRTAGYFRLLEYSLVEMIKEEDIQLDVLFRESLFLNPKLFSDEFKSYISEIAERNSNIKFLIWQDQGSGIEVCEFISSISKKRLDQDVAFFLQPELRPFSPAHLRKISIRKRKFTLNQQRNSMNWLIEVFFQRVKLQFTKKMSQFLSSQNYSRIVISPIVSEVFAELLAESAKSLKIQTIGTVSSWDNLTIKGLLRDNFDKYIVWGEGQLDEAHRLHSVPIEKIKVVGPYPFVYLTNVAIPEKVGSEKNYFLWLTSSTFITNGVENEWLLIEEFVKHCLDCGEIDLLERFHIRLHPQTPGGAAAFLEWAKIRNEGLFRVLNPSQVTCEFTETLKQRENYLLQISNSICSISLATTAGVESSLLGVPLISPPGELAKRSFNDFKHGKLLDSDYGGPVYRCNTWDDFITLIKNPVIRHSSVEFKKFFGLNLDVKESPKLCAKELIE